MTALAQPDKRLLEIDGALRIYRDILGMEIYYDDEIVVSGTPDDVAKCKKSYTGQFLKRLL